MEGKRGIKQEQTHDMLSDNCQRERFARPEMADLEPTQYAFAKAARLSNGPVEGATHSIQYLSGHIPPWAARVSDNMLQWRWN